MTAVYRNFDAEALWREYDIESTVPSLDPFRERNEALTAEFKRDLLCHESLAYGPSPAETLDLYLPKDAAQPTPLFVFIHGGYWRLGSKNSSGFMAKCLTEAGVAYAAIDYGLAPDVTVDEIVRQARASVAWIHNRAGGYGIDPDRIFVGGSSAGGHLTAMIMAPGWQDEFGAPEDMVKGAMLFSGLYDLEPLRHCEPNSWLKLDEAAAHRNSPMVQPLPNGIPLIVAYGSEETPEFCRQSADFAERCRAEGLDCPAYEMDGLNHFNVTAEICNPDSFLTEQLLGMIGGT